MLTACVWSSFTCFLSIPLTFLFLLNNNSKQMSIVSSSGILVNKDWMLNEAIYKLVLLLYVSKSCSYGGKHFFICVQNFLICEIFFINSVSSCYCGGSYGPPYLGMLISAKKSKKYCVNIWDINSVVRTKTLIRHYQTSLCLLSTI